MTQVCVWAGRSTLSLPSNEFGEMAPRQRRRLNLERAGALLRGGRGPAGIMTHNFVVVAAAAEFVCLLMPTASVPRTLNRAAEAFV